MAVMVSRPDKKH